MRVSHYDGCILAIGPMLRICALALSFAFFSSPLLAVLCETQCVRPATSRAWNGSCHSAEPDEGPSVEREGAACVHPTDVAFLAAGSDRETRQRFADAPVVFAAAPTPAHARHMSGSEALAPPGVERANRPSTRHRILRV